MTFTWTQVAIVAIIGAVCAFGIERCTYSQVEVAKSKANATKDVNIGIGKNRN
jgi:hypothetical protein